MGVRDTEHKPAGWQVGGEKKPWVTLATSGPWFGFEIIQVCIGSVGLDPLAIGSIAFCTPVIGAAVHYFCLS